MFFYIQKAQTSQLWGYWGKTPYTASPRRQCEEGSDAKGAVGGNPLLAQFSGELSFIICNQELPLALLEVTLFFHFKPCLFLTN